MTRSELLRMIGAAYDSSFQPERWPALLDQICEAFGATSALLTRVREFRTPVETWSVRFDPDCLAARFERFPTDPGSGYDHDSSITIIMHPRRDRRPT